MRKLFLCVAMLLCFSTLLGVNAQSDIDMGFETYSLSQDEIEKYANKLKLEKTYEIDKSNKLLAFSISDSGQIAIGLYDNAIINIYDTYHNYLFSYKFHGMDDRTYSLEWSEDTLLLICWGDRIIFQLDLDSNILNIEKIEWSDEFNNYLDYIHFTTEKVSNEGIYKMTNSLPGFFQFLPKTYTCLLKIDELGNEEVIFDSSDILISKYTIDFIVIPLTILITLAAIVIFLVIFLKKRVNKT